MGATGFTFSPDSPIDRATNTTKSTNPTVGIRYEPSHDLILRASYGTVFLPPDVSQLITSPPITNSGANFVDPRRGNQVVPTHQFISAGRADLEPSKHENNSIRPVVTT